MPEVKILKIAEQFPERAADSLAAWLWNLDEDRNGALNAAEISDPEGRLRCDFRVQGMGEARWKRLEQILVGASLVKKSPTPCPTGLRSKQQAEPDRHPVKHAGFFAGRGYDFIFQFGAGTTAESLQTLLRDAGAQIATAKGEVRATLPSGRALRLELNPRGDLQKVHYLDYRGESSFLTRLEFWDLLRAAGKLEGFFAANPYFREEREVWQRFYSPVYTHRKTEVLTAADLAKRSWQGVLLVGDYHGHLKYYRQLEALVRKEKLDWLALEMLPHTLQKELDDFLVAPVRSQRWREARRKLLNYLQPFWAPYYKKQSDPEGNPYYQLLLLCRSRKLKVHALDSGSVYTQANRTITPLSIGTRNRVWARHIPASGRGIVYGGAFHFSGYPKVRVQDFLWEQDPKREIQVLRI